jgi:hypothetical protein
LLRRPFAEEAGRRPCTWSANINYQSKEFSMISTKPVSVALAAALVVVLPAISAQAQAPRTFVSAAGSDSNPCSFAAPCRHFQAAVNATSAGGEVDALDPAGYGPITVGQAITIEGQGWSYIAPPANGNGITINAVSGNVSIHGVSLNGVGITGTTTGIQFNSGDSLNIHDSVIRNFSSQGIAFFPNATSKLDVSNSLMINNGDAGIYALPSGSGAVEIVLNRIAANGNSNNGIVIDGAASTGTVNVTVSESVASGNINTGIGAASASGHAPTTMMLFHSATANNGVGLLAQDANATIYIANSTVTGNAIGWATLPGGIVLSYGDNYIDGNSASQLAPPGTARK